MEETPPGDQGDEGLVEATLTYLAKSIVEHPDDVEVSSTPGEGDLTHYRVRVNPEDMGRIIGRSGRTARAIRQVARAAAVKAGEHVHIEIVE